MGRRAQGRRRSARAACRAGGGGGRGRSAPPPPPTSEDCLYINIWTAATSASAKLPVMVWSYGGAFTGGAGSLPGLRRRGAREEGRRVRHLQLPPRPVRFLRASRADEGIGPQRIRQLRRDGPRRRAQVGAGEHRGVRRRSGPRDAGRRVCRRGARVRAGRLEGRPRACITASSRESASWSGVRMEKMMTLAEAEQAGRDAAAKIGALALADLRAKPADDIMKMAAYGGRPIVDGWYVTEDLSTTYAKGRQTRRGRAGRLERERGRASRSSACRRAPRRNSPRRSRIGSPIAPSEFLKIYPCGLRRRVEHRAGEELQRRGGLEHAVVGAVAVEAAERARPTSTTSRRCRRPTATSRAAARFTRPRSRTRSATARAPGRIPTARCPRR